MSRAKNLIKENKSVKKLVKDEKRKFSDNTDAFWRTNTKAGRHYGYVDIDKEFEDNVRGWMSVAVLDKRTSAICMSLHNRFYDKKDFASRMEIPDSPPRHPNCRSIIVTMYKGNNKTKYKGQKLETFLRRNPKVAKDVMGIEKYRLWSGGQAKVSSYIDVKGRRFFRNDEIVKRLGIKSKKRLAK